MSLPSVVFIVAGEKREMFVGYTKDLEVTMSLIAEGSYDSSLIGGHVNRLVYREELPTVREAIARVDEINAMSLGRRRKLVTAKNPNWNSLDACGGQMSAASLPERSKPLYFVYVVANRLDEVRVGYSADLRRTMLVTRSSFLKLKQAESGLESLVHFETLASKDTAKRRAMQLKRISKSRLRDMVSEFNPDWEDVTPKAMLALSGGGGPLESVRQRRRDDPGPESSGGGVTADLPTGPKRPVGVRAGRYEEPWPSVDGQSDGPD